MVGLCPSRASKGHLLLNQWPVFLLPAHPTSLLRIIFVSGMQSFYFSESQDAIVLQACH